MIISKSSGKLFLFILLFLGSAQFAFADKIYLKNGNVLEGRIVEEKDQSVLLEYYLENGTGNTIVSKTQIKSIEKGPLSEFKKDKAVSFPSRPAALSKKENSGSALKGPVNPANFIPGVFFALSFISLFIINKIIKVEFDRPLVIRLGCFIINAANIALFSLSLLLVTLSIKKTAFDYSGISLFIFCFVCIVIPVLLFIAVVGLFFLRNWARIVWIILFGIGLLTGAGSLTLKKDLPGVFLAKIYDNSIGKKEVQKPQPDQNIIIFLVEFKAKKSGGAFDPRITFITASGFLLCLLYLLRDKTIEAFSFAGQSRAALFTVKKKTGAGINPRFIKSKGIIKPERFLSIGLKEYEALGYHFYLPSGMEKMGSSLPQATTAIFLEKKKNMIFSIAMLEEAEYTKITTSFLERESPYFVMLKTLTTPQYLCSTIYIREVKFEGKDGIMQVGTKNNSILYRFILKCGKDSYIECAFVDRKAGFSFGEKKVLNIIASMK